VILSGIIFYSLKTGNGESAVLGFSRFNTFRGLGVVLHPIAILKTLPAFIVGRCKILRNLKGHPVVFSIPATTPT